MKIGLVSLGCPKNLVDGEVILGYAQQAGHEITPDARNADVIVVNTCAFIDNAKQESIDAIIEMAQYKRNGTRLVVTGCLAERYRDELTKEIREIDAVLGAGEVADSVGAIEAGGRKPEVGGRRSEAGVAQLIFHPKATSSTDLQPLTSDLRRLTSDLRRLPTYLYDADSPRVITTPKHFAYVKGAEG